MSHNSNSRATNKILLFVINSVFRKLKLYYSFCIYDGWEVTKNRYFEQMINDRLLH